MHCKNIQCVTPMRVLYTIVSACVFTNVSHRIYTQFDVSVSTSSPVLFKLLFCEKEVQTIIALLCACTQECMYMLNITAHRYVYSEVTLRGHVGDLSLSSWVSMTHYVYRRLV